MHTTSAVLVAGAPGGCPDCDRAVLPAGCRLLETLAPPSETTYVPSLSWIIFQLAPVFRFFTRAYVFVSACLAVLAAIGFTRLERQRWMTSRCAALTIAVLAIVGLEFANAPPHVWYLAASPPWVKAAQKSPARSTVVEYPVAPAFSPRSLYGMFWHEHRRWTTNPPVTPEAVALAGEVAFADDPNAGAALRRAGVDYAIVHTNLPPQTTPPYQPQLPNDSPPPDTGALNPWFDVEERTSDAVLYRVRNAAQGIRRHRPDRGGLRRARARRPVRSALARK